MVGTRLTGDDVHSIERSRTSPGPDGASGRRNGHRAVAREAADFSRWSRHELQIPLEKLNHNGGAIALGHPIGFSGARLVTTLVHELRRRQGRYGLATMCIGVRQGIALVVEHLPPRS